jgi:DNA repair exonuclease SbcCD ATPase subunit
MKAGEGNVRESVIMESFEKEHRRQLQEIGNLKNELREIKDRNKVHVDTVREHTLNQLQDIEQIIRSERINKDELTERLERDYENLRIDYSNLKNAYDNVVQSNTTLRENNEQLNANLLTTRRNNESAMDRLEVEYNKLKKDYKEQIRENGSIKAELHDITEREASKVERDEVNKLKELLTIAENRKEVVEVEVNNLKAQLLTKEDFYKQKLRMIGDEINQIKAKAEELADINLKAQKKINVLEDNVLYLRKAIDEVLITDQPNSTDDTARAIYLKECFNKLIDERQQLIYKFEELNEYKKTEPNIVREVMEQCRGLKDRLEATHRHYE